MRALTHLDESGAVRMVDVSAKAPTRRRALAEAWLIVGEEIMTAVESGATPKGNIYETARIAGILGAKRCADLIPLCHTLALDHVAISFENSKDRIRVECEAGTHAGTGVEMEALTGASIAALTLYDMLKALSKSMVVTDLRLLEKSGGKSGDYRAEEVPR